MSWRYVRSSLARVGPVDVLVTRYSRVGQVKPDVLTSNYVF